jgi:uncharacterized membrane protein YeaQ/YmgE (transglycosylase-associated protein family)
MIGVISWLVCGLVVGYFVSRLISAQDKGLFFLTLSVGCAGGIAGGMCAQIVAVGSSATFSFYGVIFAFVGAALASLAYRRVIGV